MRDGKAIRAACGRDHPGPHVLADLHGRQPHPAGGTQNQQRLARLQAGAVVKRQMRGAIRDLKRGGLNIAHAVRNGHATGCRKTYERGKSAAAGDGGNPRTRQKPGHARPAGRHRSGDLHAKGKRQRGGVLVPSFGHEKIGKVQPARCRAQKNLARTGLRNRNGPQAGGGSELADLQSPHVISLACSGHAIAAGGKDRARRTSQNAIILMESLRYGVQNANIL